MKCLPFGKLGNLNMRGRKSVPYTDDTARNLVEYVTIKRLNREAREARIDG